MRRTIMAIIEGIGAVLTGNVSELSRKNVAYRRMVTISFFVTIVATLAVQIALEG